VRLLGTVHEEAELPFGFLPLDLFALPHQGLQLLALL
jgi:hypothetical protein